MYNNNVNETRKIRNNRGSIYEYTVDFPKKFDTIEEAIDFANALRNKFYRLVKSKQWHCFIYIGVSEIDKDNARIVKVKTNRRGPREKEYRKKNKEIDIEIKKPHIHIYMIGFPGVALAEEMKKYLSKKVGTGNIDDIKVKKVNRNFQLEYIKKQSIAKRIVYRDPDNTIMMNKHRRIGVLKDTNWL